MEDELKKACEEGAKELFDAYSNVYGFNVVAHEQSNGFKKGFNAALKPKHMKLTEEVKGLIEALERCSVCKMPDKGMGFGEYLNWNLKAHRRVAMEALKPFEKES